MNLQQALLEIGNVQDSELPIAGLEFVKANWSEFYPELERLIDQFIANDTSLTDDQQVILYFGTLLLAELKYSPALEKCLQLFARSDTFLTPIEAVFGDALTELTPTLFYNVVDGNTQALCNYIVDGHQAMYCKASAIEAVFAQYEAGIIDEFVLSAHVTRWITVFLALPSSTNSFLISALADSCIEYQLDNFKDQFIELCKKDLGDKGLFDEDRFKYDEVKAWQRAGTPKLIESGMIQTDFNVVDTLSAWADDDSEDEELDNISNEGFDDFESLMGEGGLLANILYDENTILENSVPVSSLPTAGRNDPCPCGSGKKYKKCCLR
ncbi:DUF1186 domain-containing protein [Colwellia psychrerythraea]|uniref:SEC-C motif domain protein n=1 Tax=Colwellia psychrerythraea TaxID=28229 RepID=A0A099KZ54_COLPS|nr:DUF1186 domain-containing protein [Colwellia psychrerythraea]KGJ95881.1 SEC-C motif domain protein [Colwellia psychrerythraea]